MQLLLYMMKAVTMITVDTQDEILSVWYQHFGFLQLNQMQQVSWELGLCSSIINEV